MGNAAKAKKLDAEKLWKEYDKDGNGILERKELTSLLQMIWKRYGVDQPLSKEFVSGIMAELDKSGNGKVEKNEFLQLFDELWEERHQLYEEHSGGSKGSRAGTPSGGNERRPAEGASSRPPESRRDRTLPGEGTERPQCPFCAHEIPGNLDWYQLSQDQLLSLLTPGSYESSMYTDPVVRHPWMPPQTTVLGRGIPASYVPTQNAQYLPIRPPWVTRG